MPDPQAIPEPEESAEPRYGGALAGIARRHEKIRSEKHLDLQVPGFEGRIKVRYRLRPEAEMERLARKIEDVQRGEDSGPLALLYANADVLVALCDRIFVRDPDGDGDWESLEDKDGPVRFEARFAAIMAETGLKIDDRRAREVVLDFFSPLEDPDNPASPRQQPGATESHVSAITSWQDGEKERIPARLLGE